MKELTVKELRKALEGVPDDLPVRLSSDTGVDQGEGDIIVEKARRVTYKDTDYFDIYANDHIYDNDDAEEYAADEDITEILSLIDEANKILEECENEEDT